MGTFFVLTAAQDNERKSFENQIFIVHLVGWQSLGFEISRDLTDEHANTSAAHSVLPLEKDIKMSALYN